MLLKGVYERRRDYLYDEKLILKDSVAWEQRKIREEQYRLDDETIKPMGSQTKLQQDSSSSDGGHASNRN